MRASLARRWPAAVAIVFAALLACAVPAVAVADAGHGGEHGATSPDPTGILPRGNWTDEQIAFAVDLVHRTEAELPAYADVTKIGAMGFNNFGLSDGTWEHWINPGRMEDSHVLDPRFPESLVFRMEPGGGRTLVAAMFHLRAGHTIDNLPAELAWLPGWHVHNELCADEQGRSTGFSIDGRCERGAVANQRPMTHVWIVDNECGHRFAGAGPGLICNEHAHGPPGTGSTVPPAPPLTPTSIPAQASAPPPMPVTAQPRYTG
jgi:hypothetical protein